MKKLITILITVVMFYTLTAANNGVKVISGNEIYFENVKNSMIEVNNQKQQFIEKQAQYNKKMVKVYEAWREESETGDPYESKILKSELLKVKKEAELTKIEQIKQLKRSFTDLYNNVIDMQDKVIGENGNTKVIEKLRDTDRMLNDAFSVGRELLKEVSNDPSLMKKYDKAFYNPNVKTLIEVLEAENQIKINTDYLENFADFLETADVYTVTAKLRVEQVDKATNFELLTELKSMLKGINDVDLDIAISEKEWTDILSPNPEEESYNRSNKDEKSFFDGRYK